MSRSPRTRKARVDVNEGNRQSTHYQDLPLPHDPIRNRDIYSGGDMAWFAAAVVLATLLGYVTHCR
jgi:hypothetical protein